MDFMCADTPEGKYPYNNKREEERERDQEREREKEERNWKEGEEVREEYGEKSKN